MDVDERGSWFHVLSEGVVLVEAGLVTDLNGAAAELLDVDRSAARGRSLISVLRDHRLERLAAGAVGVDAGENGATLELELRGRLVTAHALPGALLLRDITEATAARSEARELLAVLSHELRTPVAAIRGVLEALSSGLGAERLATERLETARLAYFVERATGEAERLSRLLTDLTVDVKPPRERTVDLFATAARAVAVTESVQRRHGVSVTLLPTSARAWVDEDKLLQALVNLLENAVIHGPADASVEIAIQDDGRQATVEVRDEGTPLASDLIEELFEPQTQAGAKSKGTGLGLYIVRSLANAWGGRAWGGSRSDGRPGNAFAFTVPLSGSR